MAALIWGAWSPDWALYNKVDFDGINKIIYVHPEVTQLDIRAEVYSAWIDWVVLRDNSKFLPAMRYSGYDPIGGSNYTGDIYFLINGWKISIDLAKVRVTGVLYSDDYATPYYTTSMVPQYAVAVAALVNTVTLPAAPAEVWAYAERTLTSTPSNGVTPTEIWEHNTRTLTTPEPPVPPTAEENADAVWAHSFAKKILTVAKFLGLK